MTCQPFADPYATVESVMPSRFKTFTKDPQAVLDYRIDWSLWLEEGDTIVASTWTATGAINIMSSSFADTNATAWLADGDVGETSTVVNHITTDLGRENDQTILIQIRER